MTGLLLLSVVLAAPDAGVPPPTGARAAAHAADAGTPARISDAGVRTDARHVADAGVHTADVRSALDGGALGRNGGSRATSIDGAPLPATHIAVQEPAAPDAGQSRKKKARADRTDGQGDPQMDALLEQSRAQTEALQQIAAQQRASEEARIYDQQARTQRAAVVDGARSNIDGAVQSLQASGNWNTASLQSTRVSLQQTAAAATAANSPAEASRASQAASLIEAAQAALAQRNPQQAQYYLLQANQLLGGGGAQNLGY
jgi:hypothetical protein